MSLLRFLSFYQSLFFTYHSIVAFMLRSFVSEGAFNALDGFFHFFEEFWYGTEGQKEYKRKLCCTGTKEFDGGSKTQSEPFSSEASTSSPVSQQADARGEPWDTANTQPSATNWQDAEQGSPQLQEESTDDISQWVGSGMNF
ncbi:hypothetical protein ABBQ32_007042 [Trebouxia sp. C0010 RCD-2024]